MYDSYVSIEDVAEMAECAISTVKRYIKKSRENRKMLPFPNIVKLNSKLSNYRLVLLIKEEDAVMFSKWYRSDAHRHRSKTYEEYYEEAKRLEEQLEKQVEEYNRIQLRRLAFQVEQEQRKASIFSKENAYDKAI